MIKLSPTTPNRLELHLVTPARFGLFPFRSPLLRESIFLSFPRGTKMYQFPRLSPHALFYSGMGTCALPQVGSPIRKSPGQRLFSTSPGLIAAVHVLHRLLAPRHPPPALNILTSKEHSLRYAVFKVRAGVPALLAGANLNRLYQRNFIRILCS